MKRLLNILLVFISAIAFAQGQSINNNYVDPTSPAEIYSPEKLAKLLTKNDTTNRQKLNTLFKWVTDNIAYNTKAFKYTSSKIKRLFIGGR